MVDRGCLDDCKPLTLLVDDRVLAQTPVDRMTPLPDCFTPTNYDVLCGRGKSCFDHVGNRRFRITIDMNLARYAKATSKVEKTAIVSSIVDTIRSASPHGGFIKKDSSGRWCEVGDAIAREKVGQALREAICPRKFSGGRKVISSVKRQIQSKTSIIRQAASRRDSRRPSFMRRESVSKRGSFSRRESVSRRQSFNVMDAMASLLSDSLSLHFLDE